MSYQKSNEKWNHLLRITLISIYKLHNTITQNQMSNGTIPLFISSMAQLIYLDIYVYEFIGTIPMFIGCIRGEHGAIFG